MSHIYAMPDCMDDSRFHARTEMFLRGFGGIVAVLGLLSVGRIGVALMQGDDPRPQFDGWRAPAWIADETAAWTLHLTEDAIIAAEGIVLVSIGSGHRNQRLASATAQNTPESSLIDELLSRHDAASQS